MRGTIVKYEPKTGRPTFGFYFVAGRDGNGKRIQIKKRGFEKKAEAEDALRQAIEEHEKQPAAKKAISTFAEFFARWDKECFSRTCSPKTAERYRELGQYGVKLFGDVPIDQLETERLAAAMNQLSDHGGRFTKAHPEGRPLAPKTVRHIAFLIQDCLRQAVDWDLIVKNPMAKVKKPKVPRRRPRILDRADFKTLVKKAIHSVYYPALVLIDATGIRRGECLALEWSDLDWDKATLEVSKSVEETQEFGLRVKGTKSGEARRFSVPARVLDVLREHRERQNRQRELYGADHAGLGLMFTRPDGFYLTPSNFGKRISKLIRSAGFTGITLHSLRHSHASELLSKGAPITVVSERLGHANPSITLGIYSHALPVDNQAAAKLWNDSMADVIETVSEAQTRDGNLPKSTTGKSLPKVVPIKSAS